MDHVLATGPSPAVTLKATFNITAYELGFGDTGISCIFSGTGVGGGVRRQAHRPPLCRGAGHWNPAWLLSLGTGRASPHLQSRPFSQYLELKIV